MAHGAREPDLGPLSELNTELQLAMVDRSERRLGSLALRRPSRLRLDDDLAGLLNPVSWSGADESALARQDPEYVELTDRVASLRAQSNGHPDWPALRALFQTEVAAHLSVTQA